MWIKICGMTSEEAVATCLQQAVDAIGFVFAPSVRRLEPRQASALAAPARGRVPCVAVMQHPTQAQLDQILSEFAPDLLQTDLDDLERLQRPLTLPLLPVLRTGVSVALTPRRLPGRLLFEGPRSGSGTASDWNAAATLARRTELILAGGLSADNIGNAIARVRPFGVDVSSGVEDAPGRKCPHKIVEFIQAARAASAGISA